MRSLYVGIDLPGGTGPIGLVALDGDGEPVATATVETDDGIAVWIEALPGGVAVAAVDAELLAPEGVDPPRAGALARRLGWTTTATNRGSVAWPACIRVDPEAVTDDVADGCARLAWLWHHRPDELRVHGDREHGYVVAPATPPAGAELHVEVDPAEIDAVRSAIQTLPGVRRVLG